MKKEELYTMAYQVQALAGVTLKLSERSLGQRLRSCGADISGLQYAVMQMLAHRDQTISEMSHKMTIEPATLVPVIDALEKKGLAQRGQDPNDRRRTPVSLTERGTALLECIPYVGEDDALVKSLRQMGDDASRQLVELLRELVMQLSGNEAMVRGIESHAREQAARK